MKMMATASTVAIVFFSSCKSKLSEAEAIDLSATPLQSIDSVYLVETSNGQVSMRVKTGKMERFENDTLTYEVYSDGMEVYAYKAGGILESTIVAERARHETRKGGDTGDEVWMATGNVVVRNIEKDQTMETDTIYWDRTKQEIFTDSYIRMYSPDGFMQGYGMRSDERARNAIITRPFNSYGVVVQDTTKVIIDTTNFIGPILSGKKSF